MTDAPYTYTPARDDSANIMRWSRVILMLVLALAARVAWKNEYGYVPLLGDVDTAIHEFGHYLFMPFGRMMTILGGSLFQVLFPLIFMGYFLRPGKRDVHAAMVCLWWASINMLDVAIYMADARAGKLMLLDGATGQESDGHDWSNLFMMWGRLGHDTIIAGRMRRIATLACSASIVVGCYAAWFGEPAKQASEVDAAPSPT